MTQSQRVSYSDLMPSGGGGEAENPGQWEGQSGKIHGLLFFFCKSSHRIRAPSLPPCSNKYLSLDRVFFPLPWHQLKDYHLRLLAAAAFHSDRGGPVQAGSRGAPPTHPRVPAEAQGAFCGASHPARMAFSRDEGGRGDQPQAVTPSRQVMNVSREGDSTISLGSLCQGSVTLRGKKFFLIFRRNFLCFSLCPLPLVLSLGTTEKSLAPSSWHPPCRYL